MKKKYRYMRRIKGILSGKMTALCLVILLGLTIGFVLVGPAAPVEAQNGHFVTIWVSNIVSGEGLNPEPETNKTGEGELDDYLLFNLSTDPSGRIDTNIGLPAIIGNFPESPTDPNYIHVTPISAGEFITLYWHWELPCWVGNDAQGDELSFDINYQITDPDVDIDLVLSGEGAAGWSVGDIKPCLNGTKAVTISFEPRTPPPTVTTTRVTAGRTCECNIDILDETYEVRIDCCNNTVTGTRLYLDPDRIHFLEIERGTALICGDCLECGNYPRWIVMSPLENPPPPPEGMVPIGPAYRLIGYSDEDMEDECSSVVFGKPVVLLLNYPSGELPGDTSAVVIAYYDEDLGEWVPLPGDIGGGRVAGVGDITAVLSHLSTFGVFARTSSPSAPSEPSPTPSTVAPPAPAGSAAHFVLSNLGVAPSYQLTSLGRFFTFVMRSGESVTVTAKVVNNGGQEGSYLADLMVNGETQATKEVFLAPGQSKEIIFDISGYKPGSYEVQIGTLRGEFRTFTWINWWLIAGVATAFGLLIWLAWYFGYRRRRYG